MLTARLRKLEQAGVVERRQYREHPPRYEYLLTAAGRELQPILLALKEWGDRHCNPGTEPIVFQVVVRSAGSDPADRLNPAVVAATEEWGIDLSRELPKPLTDDFVRAAGVVITMGLRGWLPDLSDGTDPDLQSDGCIRIATLNDPTTSWPSPNASPDRSQARTPEAAARRSWPCNHLG